MIRIFLTSVALSALLVLPAAAQSRYSRGGSTPTPTPAPQNPTPPPDNPPAVTPPPVTPPAPPPVFTSPLLLGQSSSSSILTLDSVFSSLSSQIASYNNGNPFDLTQATLNGASQTLVSPSSTPPSTGSTGGSRYSREGTTTPPPAPTGPTSLDIDVTGWSYLVLQWGNTNYHFYVGDSTGLKTFTGSAPLSSYTFFTSAAGAPGTTSVPETVSTFAALSLAAALMGLAARRWGRRQ